MFRLAAYSALALLLITLITHTAAAAEHTVSPSGGEFHGIQEAVNRAAAGDTIIVWSGVYQEKLKIDKPLIIRGLDTGGGAPVIDPEKRGDAVEITANGCTFSGFVIQNAELLSGIRIFSDRNTISGNTVKNCAQGIFLDSADNNIITGNNITGNLRTGISLEGSTNNRIETNTITKNSVGIALDEPSSPNRFSQNTIDNTVNVASKSPTSVWDSGAALSYRFLGKDHISPMGNYWGDYRGKDANGDGIGDTPYIIFLGANKRALFAANQNVVDRYPLMDPMEFYTGVREAPASIYAPVVSIAPVNPGISSPAPTTALPEPLSTTRAIPFRPVGLTPSATAFLVFVMVFCIGGGALLLLRQRDLSGSPVQPHDLRPKHNRFVPIFYGILGCVLALLSLTLMITISLIPQGSAFITGIWLLCALCTYLSASSLVLAYGILRSEPYPSIATLHGVLAILAVPCVALVMVYAPDRREPALFAFILVLAISAGMPFLQYRKRQPEILPVHGAMDRVSGGDLAPGTAEVRTVSTTIVPEQTDVRQPMVEQKSYFPRDLENKYSDITYVGRGGIAWVYAANRTSDGRRVAVKIPISFDEVTGISFLNEIKAWQVLRHKNIVEISAVNILPVPYVEMEYVAGSLEMIPKPIPVWKAVHIVRGIADALRYAHGLGIIHRDIKPHNILVTDDLTPKITDWGMSKVLALDTKKSSIAGFSLSYAAPEQVSPLEFGRTDARTDIYQLGVVFYELVTGSIPFGGESMMEVGNAILREPPIPPSGCNADAATVDRIILKCLEKDPGQRYQSADELLAALSGYLDEDES